MCGRHTPPHRPLWRPSRGSPLRRAVLVPLDCRATTYAATAQPVWAVAFELNGTPVNIPGAPTELRGPAMDAGVWVAESQALVVDRG